MVKEIYLEQKVMKLYSGSQTLGNFTQWGWCAFLESFALINIVPEAWRCQPQSWYIELLFRYHKPRLGMAISKKDQDFEFDTPNSTRAQHWQHQADPVQVATVASPNCAFLLVLV